MSYWALVYLLTWVSKQRKVGTVHNGSFRGGKVAVGNHAYASTPNVMGFYLVCAITANFAFLVVQYGVTSTLVRLPPQQICYMKVGPLSKKWYTTRDSGIQLPGAVVQNAKDLQSRPEAPEQCSIQVSDVLCSRLDSKYLLKAPCLSRGTVDSVDIFQARQGGDVVCTAEVYQTLCDKFNGQYVVPITWYGSMRHYHRRGVVQMSRFVKIHAAAHPREVATNPSQRKLSREVNLLFSGHAYIPQHHCNPVLKLRECATIPTDLSSYQGTIGKLVWPRSILCAGVPFLITILRQSFVLPTQEHYVALLTMFCCFLYKWELCTVFFQGPDNLLVTSLS